MQDSARYQAVLEIITEVFKDKEPADRLIEEYTRQRRYIGSKDRKFIIETTWNIIRNRMRLEFDIKSTKPRDILICYLKDNLEHFNAENSYSLSTLTSKELEKIENIREDVYPEYVELETPEWLYSLINDKNLVKSLNGEPSNDFRINHLSREVVLHELEKESLFFNETPYSPIGIRSKERVNLNNCIAYQDGKIDIMEEASQIAAILCNPKKDQKIIDYCSGNGDKIIALANMLDDEGRVEFHDIDTRRLTSVKNRAEKLNIKKLRISYELNQNNYDTFIVDAPSSRSGTWRRFPDEKYRLSPGRLKSLNKTQEEILSIAYRHTKIGGKIVYITSSVIKKENEDVVFKLLNFYDNLKLANIKTIWEEKIKQPYPCEDEYMLNMSPNKTNTDGMFIAILEKN